MYVHICTRSCLHYDSIVVPRSKVYGRRVRETLGCLSEQVLTHITERESRGCESVGAGGRGRERGKHTRSIDLAGVPGSRSARRPMQLWDLSAAGFGRPRPDFALDPRHVDYNEDHDTNCCERFRLKEKRRRDVRRER